MLAHHNETSPRISVCGPELATGTGLGAQGHGGPRGMGGPAAAARDPQLEQEHRADPAGPHGYPESVGTQECQGRKCLEGLIYGNHHVRFWWWA